MNINLSLMEIVALCGAITAIASAWKVVSTPVNKMNQQLKKYDEMLTKDRDHLELIDRQLLELIQCQKDSKKMDSIIARSLFLMLDHEIHGNNIEGLKELKMELEKEFLK